MRHNSSLAKMKGRGVMSLTISRPMPVEVLTKPECWKQQPGESSEMYNMFRLYLSEPPHLRKIKMLYEKYPEFRYAQWCRACKTYLWIGRSELYHRHTMEKSLNKSIEKSTNFLAEAQSATQELVATLARKMVDALKEDDDAKIKKLTDRMKPFLSMLVGYGSVGSFLLEAHKTFHGTKQTVDANVKGQLLHWGANASQPLENLKNITSLQLGEAHDDSEASA